MGSSGEGRHSAGPGDKSEGLSFLKELPILIVVAIAIALLIKTFVVQAFYIPSGSMENTLLVNDRVLVSKFVYDFGSPKRGQIVVFVAPVSATDAPVPPTGFAGFVNSVKEAVGLPSTERDFIKRVIGVGGDTIQVKNATLYVNNQAVKEPYLDADARLPSSMYNYGPITVPKNDLFVMGDNRGDSDDSRVFGVIPVSSVVGEAFVRIWPLGRFHFF